MRRLAESELSAARGSGMPGVHRREGIFIAAGPGIEARDAPPLGLAQAGALVSACIGLPTPLARLDGPWQEVAERLGGARTSTRDAGPPRGAAPVAAVVGARTPPPSAREDALVAQRLRDLGYID